MAEVRLENVTKKYGRKVAINNISFTCKEKEFLTIVGPTGAGKTTILKMIAGIEGITSGKIYFNNRVVNELPPQEREVAMAFESYNLYPNFSVYENIAFPLRTRKMQATLAPGEEKKRVEEIADFLRMTPLLERRPKELSGGEKQRVSLARALVKRPQVYLLDEPIAHLDARLKFSTQALLKELASKLGTTIVYVTHDYREALALSDRIAVLRRGSIEQIGTPREVYHTPLTDFVGKFIGEPPMNLVDGEVVTKNGETFFKAGDDFTIQLRANVLASMGKVVSQEEGKRLVRLGIRCSHIGIADKKISDNSFQLPVYAVVRETDSFLITFALKDTFLEVRTSQRLSCDIAQRFWLEFDQDHLFFYEKTLELSKK